MVPAWPPPSRGRTSSAARSPGRRSGRRSRPPSRTARVDMHLVGTDGWVSMPAAAPADPPFFPDPYAPVAVQHLRLRVPRRHRAVGHAGRGAARQGPDQRADAVLRRGGRHLPHADQPRPGAAARPLRRAHPALARLRQRDPAVRRRARALARGADRARPHVLLPPARRGHVHVPLPLRGRRARADGHDGHGVRPAQAEQGAARGRRAVRLQRRRRSTALRPRVRLHDHRAVVGGPLPRRPHPGERLDRLRPELLAAQRPGLAGHPGRPTATR